MADLKISQLPVFTSAVPAVDVFAVVSGGTTKQITTNQILGSSGVATLASATISGDLTVDTNVLKVDTTNNQVGIGTASPITGSMLDVRSAVGTAIEIQSLSVVDTSSLAINNGGGLSMGYVFLAPSTVIGRAGCIKTIKENATDGNYASAMVFGVTANGVATAERMRIASNGNVSIANGNVVMATSGKGIDFAATASGSGTMTSELLNDYEEGTWVPELKFGGANVGMTPPFIGRYTKVGRAVTVNGLLNLSNKGSSTGATTITGLPFTSANAAAEYTAVSLRFGVVSFLNVFQGYVANNSTSIEMEQITIAGAVSPLNNTNFSNNSVVIVNFTYTV